MNDHFDWPWWFWCFLLMSICSKIKVTVCFISIQKIILVLKFSLLIPSESIWPTFGISTGVDQNSAILHQVVKASVTSIIAHHPSFRPAGQKNNLPRSGLGRTVNFCCSLTHSLCSTGWGLLMSVWRKSGQGLDELETWQQNGCWHPWPSMPLLASLTIDIVQEGSFEYVHIICLLSDSGMQCQNTLKPWSLSLVVSLLRLFNECFFFFFSIFT